MNTDELREALRRDAELAGRPPTDLAPRVAGLRRRSTRRRAGVVGCVLAIAAAVLGVSVLDGAREQDGSGAGGAGIDGGSAAVAGIDTEAVAEEFRKSIQNAGGAGSRLVAPDSLVEVLPNMRYRSPFGGGLVTLSDAVVVGHVTGVRPGHAHYWPADAEDRPPVEVPFDDPRALSRTVHAEVAVTEVLAGQVTQKTVVVGFGVGTSRQAFDLMAAGLPALGEMVLFLESDSPVYAHDAAVDYGVAEDGAMLVEIGDGGRLSLPAIEPYRVERLLSATPTLDGLRAAARQPTREVPFAVIQD